MPCTRRAGIPRARQSATSRDEPAKQSNQPESASDRSGSSGSSSSAWVKPGFRIRKNQSQNALSASTGPRERSDKRPDSSSTQGVTRISPSQVRSQGRSSLGRGSSHGVLSSKRGAWWEDVTSYQRAAEGAEAGPSPGDARPPCGA